MEPLYVTRAGGIRLLTRILTLLLLANVVVSVVLLAYFDTGSAASTFVSLLVLLGVIWSLLPRRYELWPDRLRLVFPLWRWNIHYDDIEVVRPARSFEPYAFIGVRFATAPRQAITIFRRNANLFRHPNLVISPADREEFLRELGRAMGT